MQLPSRHIRTRLAPHLPAVVFGLAIVALMLLWAVHNGGFDTETWYWGGLVALALLTAALVLLGTARLRLSRAGRIAVLLFALYVAWSYLSITWAQSPGDALQGSNRALLYLLVFTLMMSLPWTPPGALAALTTYAVGTGVIGVVLITRLASHDRVSSLFVGSRLAAPTGYLNATAALFTIGCLTAVGVASRRELPGLLRGLLLALACGELQLALIVESRGWLFTLPLVVVLAILVSSDRLRLAAMAALPIIGALIPLHRLLDLYRATQASAQNAAAGRAGQAALLICGAVFVLGTILAWADAQSRGRSLSRRATRAVGTTVAVLALAGAIGAGTVATHGHPFPFISRQLQGLGKLNTTSSSSSHFADVGSGRYDFWRVALDAFVAHPIGGLGQDNYADYYVLHRHTGEEPEWTHSIELRLLAHTGAVGFALFAGFLVSAIGLALRGRRRGSPLGRGVAGISMLALLVWLIHGSVDWFWEMPALSGPALGFLGMACALGAASTRAGEAIRSGGYRASAAGDQATSETPPPPPAAGRSATGRRRQPVAIFAGTLAVVAGVVVLGVPYLSVREVSLGSDARFSDPAAALSDLQRAAALNPLSAVPDRLAGTIALQNAEYGVAQQRFRRSIEREPGGWFAWLGAGLAASGLGQPGRAEHDFRVARRINDRQPAISAALERVDTKNPLTSGEAFRLLVLVQ